MKRKLSARFIAIILVMIMLAGVLPLSALAAQGGGNGSTKSSVDHIDIGVTLQADVYVNGVKKTVTYTLTTSDASSINVSAAYADGTSVSFTRSGVSTSTDGAGKAQIRLKGNFPVGTKSNPVYYTVSVTKNFTVDGTTIPITLTATVDYWSRANVCPGLGWGWQEGYVSPGSGIDLELGAGTANYGTIQIQKTVEGAVLTADKTFVFDILDASGNVYKTVNVTVKAGQTTATAFSTVIPYGTYTVVERASSAELGDYDVAATYIPSDGKVTVGDADKNPSVHVTNAYSAKSIDVTATKIWADGDNQDGLRPEELDLTLYADGKAVSAKPEVAKNGSTWTYTWKNLPKYDGSNLISYTVGEGTVPDGYTKTVDGMTVTNTHTPEKKDVTAAKVWVDGGNQDGLRPDDLVLTLYADGAEVSAQPTITKDGDRWTYTWSNLDVYKNGKAITYTVDEANVPGGYEKSVDGMTVTNTHVTEKTDVTATKIWNDGNNQDGLRPESLALTLYADGKAVSVQPTITKDGNTWVYTWSNLDVNKDGKAITYTVDETVVPNGYTKTVDGMTVTNTHTPEKKNVTATKVWVDGDNQDGLRPNDLVLTLYADGEVVNVQPTVTKNGNTWVYTWSNLDVYKDGKAIAYTVDEASVPNGYEKAVRGLDVTNTHVPEVTEVTAAKIWADGGNQDGIRPESLELTLYADGVKTDIQPTVTKADNTWTYTWKNLPKYADGKLISYTVDETAVPAGYEKMLDGTTVTNTHIPEKTSVSGTKTWKGDEGTAYRPDSITVTLYADNTATNAVPTWTNTDTNVWSYTFENLDKFANGQEIHYTVSETPVENYITEYSGNGYDIVNTLNVNDTGYGEFTLEKINGDTSEPIPGVEFVLKDGNGNETVYVTGADGRVKVSGLAVGRYTLTERVPAGYQDFGTVWSVSVSEDYNVKLSETATGGVVNRVWQWITSVFGGNDNSVFEDSVLTVKNYALVTVTAEKYWNDDSNRDGLRPEELELTLCANGKPVSGAKAAVVKNGDTWTYTWENLPKYAGGAEIEYTVVEETVPDGYTAAYSEDTLTIVNTHEIELTSITVTKKWDDNGDQDGIRPTEIKVQLLKNGEVYSENTLTAAMDWHGTWIDLPVYENGQEIKWTVREAGTIEGYEASYDGYTITNTHKTATADKAVTKLWNDYKNKNNTRPEYISVQLYADGKAVGEPVKLTEKGGWTYTWTGLDVNRDGKAIEYTVKEVNVPDGYNVRYSKDTFTITNMLKDIPSTGDSFNFVIWAAVIAASGAAVIAAAVVQKKKKNTGK